MYQYDGKKGGKKEASYGSRPHKPTPVHFEFLTHGEDERLWENYASVSLLNRTEEIRRGPGKKGNL